MIPATPNRRTQRKPTQVIFVDNPQEFPQLQSTKQQKPRNKSNDTGPGDNASKKLNDKLQHMETRTQEKLLKMEQENQVQIEALMNSMQTQMDCIADSVTQRLEPSQDRIYRRIQDTTAVIFSQTEGMMEAIQHIVSSPETAPKIDPCKTKSQ